MNYCDNCGKLVDEDYDVEHFEQCKIDKPNKMKYTEAQKKECIEYLQYCAKEGFIDPEEALEMIKKEQWKEIYDEMDRGDYYANQKDES